MVRDERDFPVGRFRETLKLPPGTGKTLAGKQVLYQSGVTLPPGRFSVKVVVRENTTGLDGIVRGADRRAGAEAGADEGQLGRAQHAAADRRRRERPTIRSSATASSCCRTSRTSSARIRSCSSTTRSTIPVRPNGIGPQLRTSLAFYRGKVKVFETPVVERTASTRPIVTRRSSSSRCPASSFTPGLYTCQINIIDTVSGKFEFPRLMFAVR